MGNSWPGAREGPAQRPAQGEDELSAALEVLRAERGSQWTEEMEGLVEYHLRTNWPGPCTKETQHQWTARLCATYDQNEPAMQAWLRRRLPAAETQWKEEGGHTKDYGRDPPGAPVGRSQSPAERSPRTPTRNSGPGTRAGPVEDGARDGEERLGTPAARSTGGTTTGAATTRGAPARHPPTHGTKGTTKGCEVRKRREPPPTHGEPTPTTSSVSSPRSSSRRRRLPASAGPRPARGPG